MKKNIDKHFMNITQKNAEKTSAIKVLEILEKEAYICGDLMCIPKNKFYTLLTRVEKEQDPFIIIERMI